MWRLGTSVGMLWSCDKSQRVSAATRSLKKTKIKKEITPRKTNDVVVGTNDMDAAVRFYDQRFEEIEMNRASPTERITYWLGPDLTFATAIPVDEEPATKGNGSMVGFSFGSSVEVQRLHALAIDLIGTNEGDSMRRGLCFLHFLPISGI